MYKNVLNTCRLSAILLTIGLFQTVNTQAQISLTGQLRTRAEYRNGYGNLVTTDAQPGGFISQRTRLTFGYKWDLLTIGTSIQDVRVFGADASSISATDNRLFLHEGWAELTLANKADTNVKFKWLDLLTFKIGRQELVYDDARLIGNLDWLQQGRRHDMALLKAVHHGWQVDLGFAFNQNTDAAGVTNTEYVPGNIPAYVTNSNGVLVPTPAGIVPLAPSGSASQKSAATGTPVYSNPTGTNGATQDYKSFTSLYISKKIDQTKFSALFFNDNFGQYNPVTITTADGGFIYGRRFVQANNTDLFDYSPIHRYTYGLMINHTLGNASGFGKIALQAAYYQQSGKDRDNVDLDAYHYTVALTYQKGRFSFTPGYDVLSGNDVVNPSGKDNRFDPLYGTPHKFWGYMDYFYTGTGSPVGGLNNPYFKVKYTANTLTLGADIHHFSLNKDMKKADGSVIDKDLGNELDLQLSYQMNKFTNIELGYSLMKASDSMTFAKGQATTDAVASTYNKTAFWGYVMFKFTPDFFYAKPVAIKQ
ncbi:alginate export family protein [Mucilaginibacter sp. HMF5004]|uniref:alginate export family protein n=1 Tax=Mucilaginibacter rivuli TaxID=2857527 RepID=UPI001C5E8098|nr:alginate export family protein [Mucilaginibacter rivuli]MBW4889970.1 alginate export family protein [Mucilaginibacter rivuli]